MYTLSDQQVDFILNDIKIRGVEMEDLQLNFLDHICCIMESEYTPDGDFQQFYQKTISRFFKKELKEIEEETIFLLTFKNYYAMKKVMINTGAISAAAFIFGCLFKIMHWPGASFLIILGMVGITLVFMPLMFLLKAREVSSNRDKIVIGIGTLAGIIFCIGTLFKFQHWPGAYYLWLTAIGMSFLLFIPIYFFTGIRNPDTKVNTIITTILVVLVTGIQFAMINIRPSKKQTEIKMYTYLQNEDLLKKIQAQKPFATAVKNENSPLAADIYNTCEQLKGMILIEAIGQATVPKDFEQRGMVVEEGSLGNDFYSEDRRGTKLFQVLKTAVQKYNESRGVEKIPVEHSILDAQEDNFFAYNNLFVLNSLTQVQMFLVQSEMESAVKPAQTAALD